MLTLKIKHSLKNRVYQQINYCIMSAGAANLTPCVPYFIPTELTDIYKTKLNFTKSRLGIQMLQFALNEPESSSLAWPCDKESQVN